MMLAVDPTQLLDAFGALPAHTEDAAESAPQGHGFLGAIFLFIGSLLVVEMLAGQVWSRALWRKMFWPGGLIAAGLAMLVVSYIQPTEKSLHLTLAILLLMGGYFEARYRLGDVSREAADAFAIPALIVGGFVIGPMHANGPLLYSAGANTHMLVGISGWALAGIKLMRVRYGPTAALEGGFASGVMMLGLSLLLVQQFHAGH